MPDNDQPSLCIVHVPDQGRCLHDADDHTFSQCSMCDDEHPFTPAPSLGNEPDGSAYMGKPGRLTSPAAPSRSPSTSTAMLASKPPPAPRRQPMPSQRVRVLFRSDRGCYCNPQCGGYEIFSEDSSRYGNLLAGQWATRERAVQEAEKQGWVVINKETTEHAR